MLPGSPRACDVDSVLILRQWRGGRESGCSTALSAIIDNTPYAATMSAVVAELGRSDRGPDPQVLRWSLALGADLGGYATAIGA